MFSYLEEYNRIKSGLKEQSKEEARNKASATSIEGVDADGLPLALRMDDYDDEGKLIIPYFNLLTHLLTRNRRL